MEKFNETEDSISQLIHLYLCLWDYFKEMLHF